MKTTLYTVNGGKVEFLDTDEKYYDYELVNGGVRISTTFPGTPIKNIMTWVPGHEVIELRRES